MHNILRELRKHRGLTIKTLAERMNYSYSSIRDAEVGRRITSQLLSAYNRFFRRDIPDEIKLTCSFCKEEFISQKGLQLYCPKCCNLKRKCGRGETVLKPPQVAELNPNPITKDTVMIICMFHLEGLGVKEIGIELSRPPEVIEKLLGRAVRDGRYRMYRAMKNADVICCPAGKLPVRGGKAYKHKAFKEDRN